MQSFKALMKSPVVIAGLVVIIVIVVLLVWPSATLWSAKRKARTRYAEMNENDRNGLNIVPAAKVRRIRPGVAEGDRVGAPLEGYFASLPADAYALQPQEQSYVDFESDALTIRLLGVGPLTNEFRKARPNGSDYATYFQTTDPYQIVIDAFAARPDQIPAQTTHEALQKHLTLLLLKAVLQPGGSDVHWENFDTGRYRGNLAGDTSLGGIIVLLYLPKVEAFAHLVLFPKDGATMADVYDALGSLIVEPAPESASTEPAHAEQVNRFYQNTNRHSPGASPWAFVSFDG